MKTEILFCTKCGLYSLKQHCPNCRQQVFSPKPPRYSPLDKWGEWRRKAKKELKN
ncbi:MAG TPA: RNA-protein complex protein Nop10 [Candidatus Nanoarchaeia archaeon]|nr:RNA-protein complex protein Nop10 [Candidatus Nanoarchaeia archaeon]